MTENGSTLSFLLEEGTRYLTEHGIAEAGLDAWLLLEYTANISRAEYYKDPKAAVSADQRDRYLELVRKRGERIPLQHLTRRAFFMGYEFYVDGRVLIPRQDTEILAEEALLRAEESENPHILDLCTGSGCLLISFLLEKPGSTGTGADLSADALEVAALNAERLLGDQRSRAQFVQSDLFYAPYFYKKYGKEYPVYDMIISNPPYVRTEEIGRLEPEVRVHDPWMALDGGEDGLSFYRRIIGEAPRYLRDGGWLLLEIGCDQAAAVSELLVKNGFSGVQIINDLSHLPRVAAARLNR